MELKDIAAVSGKGGLFKIVKPTRTGVIIESIDKQKKRSVAGATSRVSILQEISIYTTGAESSLPLEDVLKTINKKYGSDIKVSSKSSEKELRSFLSDVVPDYDEDKVYLSDIKKLISWYNILTTNVPELFKEKKAAAKKEEKPKASEKKSAGKSKAASATKKPVAKKSAATAKSKSTPKKGATKKATKK